MKKLTAKVAGLSLMACGLLVGNNMVSASIGCPIGDPFLFGGNVTPPNTTSNNSLATAISLDCFFVSDDDPTRWVGPDPDVFDSANSDYPWVSVNDATGDNSSGGFGGGVG